MSEASSRSWRELWASQSDVHNCGDSVLAERIVCAICIYVHMYGSCFDERSRWVPLHSYVGTGGEVTKEIGVPIIALLFTLANGACIRAYPWWVFQGSDEGHLKEAGGTPTRCLEETNDVAWWNRDILYGGMNMFVTLHGPSIQELCIVVMS